MSNSMLIRIFLCMLTIMISVASVYENNNNAENHNLEDKFHSFYPYSRFSSYIAQPEVDSNNLRLKKWATQLRYGKRGGPSGWASQVRFG
uniref:Uncharacterized protein n=1 Tax=Acrobeloides nanus TaxID=290746 RepID=A0A914BZN0_9BILA